MTSRTTTVKFGGLAMTLKGKKAKQNTCVHVFTYPKAIRLIFDNLTDYADKQVSDFASEYSISTKTKKFAKLFQSVYKWQSIGG